MNRRAAILLVLSLSVVGASGLVYRSYRSEIDGARAAAEAGGHIIQTAAGVIEYAERGGGSPLLSIHGAGGGYDQGLAVAAELVGDGFRIVAPSRFGYLGTPVPAEASVAAQADAHAALLDALEIDKAIVVGTSAGARSAIELALRHPGRVLALALIVPGTYAPASPVMVEGSRASKLTLRLVNAGADSSVRPEQSTLTANRPESLLSAMMSAPFTTTLTASNAEMSATIRNAFLETCPKAHA